jgi:hypothetical protein
LVNAIYLRFGNVKRGDQIQQLRYQEEGEFAVLLKWMRLAKEIFSAEILVKSQFTVCVPTGSCQDSPWRYLVWPIIKKVNSCVYQ